MSRRVMLWLFIGDVVLYMQFYVGFFIYLID